jgi:EPS-associated MarR family transcriptional regulator
MIEYKKIKKPSFCMNIFVQSCGSLPDFFFQLFFLHLMNKKDIRLDLLRRLESNPEYTQRELSKVMGVSLGKVNYCLKKLTEKGLIKITNFKQSPNKVGYAYLLTPKGIEEKSRLTFSFLKRKINEYEILKIEINELKLESEQIHNEKR